MHTLNLTYEETVGKELEKQRKRVSDCETPILNIPIYRAKKIDSDKYVIGFYSSAYDIHHYIITHLGVDTKANVVYQMSTDIHKIDPTTISIHFPDMLASDSDRLLPNDKKDLRIFASLSEDGKGGDILEDKYSIDCLKFCTKEQVIKVQSKNFNGWNEVQYKDNRNYFDNSKVIGIRE